MNNLKRSENIFRWLMISACLAVLAWVSFGDGPMIFRWIGLMALGVVALAFAHASLTKISKTEIDFASGEVRQFRALPFVSMQRFKLGDFSAVLSSISGRRLVTSVRLTGRNRTITLAYFGADGTVSTADRYDNQEAQELRQQIASSLNLRDLGVI